MKRRYLDHNATTPLGAAAHVAVAALLNAGDAASGNPSSLHERGRRARDLIEGARRSVASLVGAAPLQVTFTGSGSEAIALGLIGLARGARAKEPGRTRILVGASEHPAVHGAAEVLASSGFTVETIAVDAAGRVLDSLAGLDERVAVLALQVANHETGVLQPVRSVVAAARERGARVFSDAVQAVGKVAVDLADLGVDAIAIAGHKIYGPKGIGALVLREGLDVDPLVPGGHQERGRRAGTEAVWAIAGFGAAAVEAGARLSHDGVAQAALRDQLDAGLVSLGATVFGLGEPRVPNTSLFAFQGASGQLVAIALDLAGFEVSTGAACSSGSLKPSAVLLAAGHDPALAACAVRVSLGRENGPDDVRALLSELPGVVQRVRQAS